MAFKAIFSGFYGALQCLGPIMHFYVVRLRLPFRLYSRSQTESIASSPHEEGGIKDISSRKVGGRWPQFKDSGGGT